MIPGVHVVVDESFSMWEGKDGRFRVDGLPHVSKIPRKPRGIGIQFKNMADGQTGIMLKLEIVKGKVEDKKKPHYIELGATVSTALRLTQELSGSWRVVIGDSWFSSVKLVESLRQRGLFYVGVVKQNHSEYPIMP